MLFLAGPFRVFKCFASSDLIWRGYNIHQKKCWVYRCFRRFCMFNRPLSMHTNFRHDLEYSHTERILFTCGLEKKMRFLRIRRRSKSRLADRKFSPQYSQSSLPFDLYAFLVWKAYFNAVLVTFEIATVRKNTPAVGDSAIKLSHDQMKSSFRRIEFDR